ncbi:MAG: beta-hydroxyacyl-ACP dehydratase, partial [Planctomycetota bacterium]
MAATPFIDLNNLDLNQLIITKEQIYQRLPHRYEFMQLDGIIHFDLKQEIGVGLRKIRQDEFWIKGHIPSRPLFPGVLMIETAAHLASYLSYEILEQKRFMGFG